MAPTRTAVCARGSGRCSCSNRDHRSDFLQVIHHALRPVEPLSDILLLHERQRVVHVLREHNLVDAIDLTVPSINLSPTRGALVGACSTAMKPFLSGTLLDRNLPIRRPANPDGRTAGVLVSSPRPSRLTNGS
jgi:hypothetical protein